MRYGSISVEVISTTTACPASPWNVIVSANSPDSICSSPLWSEPRRDSPIDSVADPPGLVRGPAEAGVPASGLPCTPEGSAPSTFTVSVYWPVSRPA